MRATTLTPVFLRNYYPRPVIYDITNPLNDLIPIYPGDPDLKIEDWRTLANGDAANVTVLHLGAHTGTHVDAPAHFIEGASRVDSLALDVLIGHVLVVEVPLDRKSIDESLVREHCPPGVTRVIFKTRNSTFWNAHGAEFRNDFTFLELAGAHQLVELGVQLVGIDYLSIEKFGSEDHQVHLRLLSQGIIILEGLNLSDISAGEYELICLPLRLSSGHGDGAPARAVLRTLNN